eukprot:c28071_g1_i1.p1 GENE.c28071_g1_i1~~c28071_g1_i1.p1  ORF type:complete len:107 (-),score=20.66 c28071_g1_i1:103-387(-)
MGYFFFALVATKVSKSISPSHNIVPKHSRLHFHLLSWSLVKAGVGDQQKFESVHTQCIDKQLVKKLTQDPTSDGRTRVEQFVYVCECVVSYVVC